MTYLAAGGNARCLGGSAGHDTPELVVEPFRSHESVVDHEHDRDAVNLLLGKRVALRRSVAVQADERPEEPKVLDVDGRLRDSDSTVEYCLHGWRITDERVVRRGSAGAGQHDGATALFRLGFAQRGFPILDCSDPRERRNTRGKADGVHAGIRSPHVLQGAEAVRRPPHAPGAVAREMDAADRPALVITHRRLEPIHLLPFAVRDACLEPRGADCLCHVVTPPRPDSSTQGCHEIVRLPVNFWEFPFGTEPWVHAPVTTWRP